jgi:hypothetical protein
MTTSNNIAPASSTISLRHPLSEFKLSSSRDNLAVRLTEMFRQLPDVPVYIKGFYTRRNIATKNIGLSDLKRRTKDIQGDANRPTSFKNVRPEKLQLLGNGREPSKTVQGVNVKDNWTETNINPSTRSNSSSVKGWLPAIVPSRVRLSRDYWSWGKSTSVPGNILQRKTPEKEQSVVFAAIANRQGAAVGKTNVDFLLSANRKLADIKNARSAELIIPGIVEKDKQGRLAPGMFWPGQQIDGRNITQEFSGLLQQKNRELTTRKSDQSLADRYFAKVVGPTGRGLTTTSTFDQRRLVNDHPFHPTKGRLNAGTQPFFSMAQSPHEKQLKTGYPIDELIVQKSRNGQGKSSPVNTGERKNGTRTTRSQSEQRIINLNLNSPIIENFTIQASSGNESMQDFKQKVEEVLLDILKSANAIN